MLGKLQSWVSRPAALWALDFPLSRVSNLLSWELLSYSYSVNVADQKHGEHIFSASISNSIPTKTVVDQKIERVKKNKYSNRPFSTPLSPSHQNIICAFSLFKKLPARGCFLSTICDNPSSLRKAFGTSTQCHHWFQSMQPAHYSAAPSLRQEYSRRVQLLRR